MANPDHLKTLQQAHQQNASAFRIASTLSPGLIDARLRAADLSGATLSRADLERADLVRADLWGADLLGANLREANLREAKLSMGNLARADLLGADLRGADLREATFREANLREANLREANLEGVDFARANLGGANLREANLREANLREAKLSEADLTRADLTRADLRGATLLKANLRGANLSEANLNGANLSEADIRESNLIYASLIDVNITNADLTGCHIYGISAWGLMLSDETKQRDLIITKTNEAEITIDNIEVAQFIYLIIRNQKIRYFIDTITSKVVLILGRFIDDHKEILGALRDELRKRDYLPILFDFDKPASRTTDETITLLARMARFVIADISDAKSVLQELRAIVPELPSVPVQPVIVASQEEPGMFDFYRGFRSFLPVHRYDTPAQLLIELGDQVIEPSEAKALEFRATNVATQPDLERGLRDHPRRRPHHQSRRSGGRARSDQH
jgi:uncharacterized protein YjbI with pentapeptide repeats